ncbi:DUF2207 domain-containing protein [Neolewinella persica]|uniref:DUF2207 domain-containing protein n=1 Tax=Neolewinella persica TaxID=70998 RepID=UPI000372DFFD|nr:DUF2207 domain-containing protein [Neolewinella persica]
MRLFIFCLLFLPLLITAQREEFSQFNVAVTVQQDGTLNVNEDISVISSGKVIKRGITRALPRGPIGDDVDKMERFDYDIQSVSRDGSSEDYHTKNEGDSKVVYFGSKDRRLDPGPHRYGLTYDAPKQIYFFDDREEVRWTLAGIDTRLPIRAASLTLTVPGGMNVLGTVCYTGSFGSTEQACEMVKNGNQITYTLSRQLAEGEGMIIAAVFPTGSFVKPAPPPPPTALQKSGTKYISFIGMLIALMYGYRTWQIHGIDPPTPEVGPQFTAPRGLSAASMHYLNSYMPSQTQLTASLTDLAIKGYLKIDEEERSGLFSTSEIFVLRPLQKDPETHQDLAPEQIALYNHLRNMGDIDLDGEYDKRLAKATEAHNKSLKEQHADYLKEGGNGWKVLPYGLIMLATVVGAAIFLNHAENLGIVLFIFAVTLLIVGTPLYAWLIRKPSEDKVKLWAEIKAMKQYLKLSEKERRGISGAPEMTEEYFQSVLPYAIALGIENNWALDLQSDLAGTLNNDRSRHSMHMYPFMMPGFGSKMNTAYGAVSSPPSSSGGSAGGGSVGGGGGSGGW